MPPKLDWKLVQEFETNKELVAFSDNYLNAQTTHNNKTKCNLIECDVDERMLCIIYI